MADLYAKIDRLQKVVDATARLIHWDRNLRASGSPPPADWSLVPRELLEDLQFDEVMHPLVIEHHALN